MKKIIVSTVVSICFLTIACFAQEKLSRVSFPSNAHNCEYYDCTIVLPFDQNSNLEHEISKNKNEIYTIIDSTLKEYGPTADKDLPYLINLAETIKERINSRLSNGNIKEVDFVNIKD